MSKNYCIYDGYVSRTEYNTCEQTTHTDEFQNEVYQSARVLCVENICSDVVEHVLDPDELISFINQIDFKHLILSTPDRDIVQALQKSWGRDVKQHGPPYNIMHVREWSFEEFNRYISMSFEVEEHFMTPMQKECQVIIARPKST